MTVFCVQGESTFWRRKMHTLHNHLDVNKDGVISYDDFMLLGERFADLGHLSPSAKKDFQNALRVSIRKSISPLIYKYVCI